MNNRQRSCIGNPFGHHQTARCNNNRLLRYTQKEKGTKQTTTTKTKNGGYTHKRDQKTLSTIPPCPHIFSCFVCFCFAFFYSPSRRREFFFSFWFSFFLDMTRSLTHNNVWFYITTPIPRIHISATELLQSNKEKSTTKKGLKFFDTRRHLFF